MTPSTPTLPNSASPASDTTHGTRRNYPKPPRVAEAALERLVRVSDAGPIRCPGRVRPQSRRGTAGLIEAAELIPTSANWTRQPGSCSNGITPAPRKSPVSRAAKPSFSARTHTQLPPSQSLPAQLRNLDPLVGFDVSLAPKPVFHRRLQPIERHAMAGLQQSFGTGKRVVEDRVIGKVAHRKIIDPVQRAGVPIARCIDSVDRQLTHEHVFSLNGESAVRPAFKAEVCSSNAAANASRVRIGIA